MRAKVASVVFVACGVLGAAALATPGTAAQLASRGSGDGGGHDNGQQDNYYDHSCTSNNRHVIGSICVIVDDLPILGHILSSEADEA
jgi:hypothetical protein